MEEIDTMNSSKDIMTAMLLVIKNSHKNDLNEVEKIYTQIISIIRELSNKLLFSKEEIEDNSEIFFFNSFAPDLIRVILNDYNSNSSIRELQKEILALFLKEYSINLNNAKLNNLWETVSSVFSEEHNFHRGNDSKDPAEMWLDAFYKYLNPDSYKWRNELEPGSMIDYLYRDKESNFYKSLGVSSWTRAEIIDIDENKYAILRLIGTGEIVKNVTLFSTFLLPFNTLSKDFDFRQNLKEGDEVDYLDNRSWYRSTIVEVKDRHGIKSIKYGLRIYRDDARLTDQKGRKYYGWSETFDKEISAHDPKIRQPDTFAKKIENYQIINSYPIDSKKFNEIESFIPFEISIKKFYVIPRKNENKNLDLFYYTMINDFCDAVEPSNLYSNDNSEFINQVIPQRGLDMILSILENAVQTKSINYDTFSIIVETIHNLHAFLHYHYAQDFLIKFGKYSLEILIQFSKLEIRNFKRDKLESLVKKMKDILFKVYLESDVNAIFDVFGVEFGINCFKYSTILDKKLLGLKILTDTLFEASKGLSTNSLSFSDKHISPTILLEKVLDHSNPEGHLFDTIFSSQTHSQILQKSPELLKTLFMGKVLSSKDMIKLIQIAKECTDLETKNLVYKGMMVNINHISADLANFAINKLIELTSNQNNVSTQDIELVISLFKSLPTFISKEIAPKVAKYFFDLIFTYDNQSDHIINEYVSLMKTWEFRECIYFYVEMIMKIMREDTNGFIKPMKILRRLLQSLFNVIDENTKINMLNFVLSEKSETETKTDIVTLTMNFLSNYHANVKTDSKAHSEVMNEVINFLSFFINHSKTQCLSNDHIFTLYKIYVEEAVSNKDSNLFFKWLKEADDKKVIPSETFQMIFSNMISNTNAIEFSNISMDLFQCLWNIFLAINKNKNYLQVSEYKGEAYSNVSSAGQTLLSFSYNNDKKNEIEIKCLIDNPDELIGIDLIWRLVVNSTTDVNKSASNNFLKLFLNNELEPVERSKRWNQLINRAIETIKSTKESKNIDKKQIIINSLSILRYLIEETEKKGTAGVISHSSILKSNIITVKIANYLSTKTRSDKNEDKNIDKNFSLKVYANTTLWDLKKLIGDKIGVIPESIKLVISSTKDITENDHGKSLSDLKFKDEEQLTIVKNPILDSIPKQVLIKDNDLSKKAKHAFKEIFGEFSTNGLMNREQCSKFAYIAVDSAEPLSVEDNRIKHLFDLYDFDKDDHLDVEGFYKFFKDSILEQKKTITVWENLKAFNYRNDLKKLNEPLDEYNTDINIMPRFLLAKNTEYFNTIFELQDESEAIAREASKFLNMICTNPSIFRDIILLRNNNWNDYLDRNNIYKLFYSMQIIESFFEEFELGEQNVNSEPLELTILEEQDRELLQPNHKIEWFEKFLTKGGINHIVDFLVNHNFSDFFANKANSLHKKCYNLTLKIIRNSLGILFRSRNAKNNKTDVMDLIKKQSSTLDNYLNSDAEGTNLFGEEKTDKNDKTEKTEYVAEFSVWKPGMNNQNNSAPVNNTKVVKNNLEATLIEKLNVDYTNILTTFNFNLIAGKLITLAFEISKKTEAEFEERSLNTNSINLLSMIVISQEDFSSFLNFIYNFNEKLNGKETIVNFENFILSGILQSSNLLIRINNQKIFKNLAIELNKLGENSLIINLLKIAIKKIANLTPTEKTHCKYFFELIQSLLDTIFNSNSINISENIIDYNKLCEDINYILSNEYNTIEEELLNGYLKILNTILTHKKELKYYLGYEKNLVKVIIDKYLLKDIDNFDSMENSLLVNPDDEKYKNILKIPNYSSVESRTNLFNVLVNLTEDTRENLMAFFSNKKITEMGEYISILKKEKKYYNPSNERKNQNGYVGLKNMACICYMNSVLQQFFNVPSFRYAILQTDDKKAANYTDPNNKIDDNVLHQLQKMFTHLELSNRMEYNPIEFCYAFKGLDGLPTNVAIQQDSQEFLGRLFDILENSIKNTEYKYLLNSVFVGKTCTQLICKGGCGRVRTNIEDCYNLSLEVQNKKTLKESLEKYISEERIDEYFCDSCNKKVTLIKRNSFAELPNVLIIHLQRILFNYDSLMNEKINSRLEFPKRLNLKDYCTETITAKNPDSDESYHDRIYTKNDDYYDYELVGVVVHLGIADAGHYYSFINTKRDGKDNSMNYDPNSEADAKKHWLTFNDSTVNSYLIRNLEEDCFGGCSAEKEDDSWAAKNKDWDNSKNAYMLVYERIKKSPIKIVVNNHFNDNIITFNEKNKYSIEKQFNTFNIKDTDNDAIPLDCENTAISRWEFENKIFYNEETKESFIYVPFYHVERKIPFEYFKEVSLDNLHFINDQKIYSSSFSVFLEKIVANLNNLLKSKNIDYENVQKIFGNILYFVIEILAKSNFRDNLNKIIENINLLVNTKDYNVFSEIILGYLIENKDKLIEILFSSEENANLSYKSLIVNSILVNVNVNRELIEKDLEDDAINNSNSSVINILNYLISLIPSEASKNWTKILAYLELFEYLTQVNETVLIEYFMKKELISKFVDFLLGKESPYYKSSESRNEMGNKISSPKFSALVTVVGLLARHCFTDNWTESDLKENRVPLTYIKTNEEKAFYLSEKDYNLILNRAFYKKAIKDAYNNTALSKLLAHLMDNNIEFSKKRVFMIMESINEGIGQSDAKNAFDLLFNVLAIEDQYTNTRLEWIMGIPQIAIRSNDSNNVNLPQRDAKYGDKIYKYISPLLYGTYHDSLIERVLYKYQASSDYVTILTYFFGSIYKSHSVFNYFDALPHPKTDGKLLYEYAFQLANEEINRIFNVTAMSNKYEKSIKSMNKIMEGYINKREEFNKDTIDLYSDVENNNKFDFNLLKHKFAPKYSFGEIVRDKYQFIEDEISSNNVFPFIVDYDTQVLLQKIPKEEAFGNTADNEDVAIETEIPITNTNDIIEDNENIENINTNKFKVAYNNANDNYTRDSTNEENELDKAYIDQEDNLSVKAVNGDDEDNSTPINIRKEIEKEPKYNNLDVIREECKETEDNQVVNQKQQGAVNKHINDTNAYTSSSLFFSEDSFIRSNLDYIIQNEHTRTYHIKNSFPLYEKIVVSTIKRYIVFNSSDKEFKVRYTFSSNDDFINTYMPSSEIVVIAKKNTITNVYNFVKEDINLPWNEINVKIECEPYESANGNNDFNDDAKENIRKSRSYNDLAGNNNNDNLVPLMLPAPDPNKKDDIAIEQDDDGFPMECPKCGNLNIIKSNSATFNCKSCKADLWG